MFFELDLIACCPDHGSCDLPWIVTRSVEELLRSFVAGVLTGQVGMDFRPAPVATIRMDMAITHGPETPLDLSYMLILELRDFYYQKDSSFLKSVQAFQRDEELYNSIRLQKICLTIFATFGTQVLPLY